MGDLVLVVEPATKTRQNHRVQIDSSGCPGGDYITLTEKFPKGVKALYCQADKKIKTFLFDKDVFSIEQAKAWARKHSDWKGGLEVELRTVGTWVINPALSGIGLADKDTAWSFDGDAVLGDDDWGRYAKANLIHNKAADSDHSPPEMKGAYGLPIATMVGGTLKYVLKGVLSAYGAVRGARSPMKAPKEVQEAAFETLKKIANRFGHDTKEWKFEMTPFETVIYDAVGADKRPMLMVALSPKAAVLGLVRNNEGWIKKEILRTGNWAGVPSGSDVPLVLDLEDLEDIKAAFDDKAIERVSVPLEHSRSPMDNTGFVQALEIGPCADGSSETALYAWLEFTETTVEQRVVSGSIWAVSCWIHGPYMRPVDGKIYPLVLRHVSLVDAPFVEGMEPFVKEQAVASNQLFLRWEGGKKVGEKDKTTLTLEGADLERHNALLALGMTAEELKPLTDLKLTAEELEAYKGLKLSAKDLTALMERSKKLAEQEKGVFERERVLAITNIVLALEGKAELDGVHKEEGHRHYPVVVTKVEELLKAVPFGAVSIKLSQDGKGDREVSVDSLILEVVNSLPKEARVGLSESESTIPFGPKEGKPGDSKGLTDIQVYNYLLAQGRPISEDFKKKVEAQIAAGLAK